MDGLNFLTGKTMDYVNKKAFEGTVLAHTDGGCPTSCCTCPVQRAVSRLSHLFL